MSGITIAIDGYSSCGKSTLAKEIAKALNYVYVDSGAMYRAVTLYCQSEGLITKGHYDATEIVRALPEIEISFQFKAELGKSITLLNGKDVETDIRTSTITQDVSVISAISEVRSKLVQIQQEMGAQGGVVMDGRDIGTVVFPNAELKLFMTASTEVRAKRRFDELTAKGETISLEEVKTAIVRRDQIDMNREISPLRKAEDAIELDNSHLNREEQFERAMQLINSKLNKEIKQA